MRKDHETLQLRDIEIGDVGWLIQRHGELYHQDENFDASFELLVADVLVNFVRTRDPATQRAFIAVRNGQRLGSILCVGSSQTGIAQLRLFFVEPTARRTGLGQTLLTACMDFARDTGHHRLRLATHASHKAACALYQKNGFTCLSEKPVRSFGVDLIEQTWAIDLV